MPIIDGRRKFLSDSKLHRMTVFLWVVISVSLLLSCKPQAPAPEEGEPKFSPEVVARVNYVIDGDTVILESGEKIRFLGLDTPEIKKSHAGKDQGREEPWGRDAANYLTVLLQGKEVGLEFDSVKKGTYGRTLAYVILGDELVNALLLKEGYARYKTYDNVLKYGDYLKEQEGLARIRGKGLWEEKGKLKTPRYFLASKSGDYYHLPDCEYARKIRKENRFRLTADEARRLGLKPCNYCVKASKN